MAIELLEESLEARVSQLGDKHHLMATTRRELAATFQHLGKSDIARDLYQTALTTQNQNATDRPIELARTLSAKAGMHIDLREPEQARSDYEKARSIFERELGLMDLEVGIVLSNLAIVYRELQDDSAAIGNPCT
jgi:tetratricopeptide (TPR) repeat protein